MSDVTQDQAAPAAPSIELADLQNAVKIIDYACEQGAFKGWQVIEQVIAVREKIATFLKAAAPAPVEEEPAAPAKKPASKKTAAKK
jgi:hypothetical protein